ncbi:MAG: hypothetical protein JNK23_17240 [Opitutaceae bacterium]|nr:hypothetical protein [Opitutaceae bacterium]
MKSPLPLLLFALAASWPAVASPPAKAREEAVFLFENRRVVVAVPEGFGSSLTRDENGMAVLQITDPKERYSLELRFLPDPDGRFATSRARREQMVEMFSEHVGASTEQGMQFEELEPKSGAGVYCLFTDAKLVGHSKLPPGEYIHLTAGLKTWRGVVAIFRFFSNETTSAEYQAVMKMLRESVHEQPAPLR